MTVVAGVDVGNATTEVVLVDAAARSWARGGRRPAAERVAGLAAGAAALVRRLERQSAAR